MINIMNKSNDQRGHSVRFAGLPDWLHFFWAGVASQQQTGAVVPSQRFLVAKMVAPVPPAYQGRIIELGAGTGVLTRYLAQRCPDARILACEINPALMRVCQRNLAQAGLSGKVELVADSAQRVLAEIRRSQGELPGYIISGIPLGNLDGKQTLKLIASVRRTLPVGGMYIQFQYSLLDRKRIRACFSSLRLGTALLNFPPAVVYYARR
jgi:phospholipid N-methyltransferase